MVLFSSLFNSKDLSLYGEIALVDHFIDTFESYGKRLENSVYIEKIHSGKKSGTTFDVIPVGSYTMMKEVTKEAGDIFFVIYSKSKKQCRVMFLQNKIQHDLYPKLKFKCDLAQLYLLKHKPLIKSSLFPFLSNDKSFFNKALTHSAGSYGIFYKKTLAGKSVIDMVYSPAPFIDESNSKEYLKLNTVYASVLDKSTLPFDYTNYEIGIKDYNGTNLIDDFIIELYNFNIGTPINNQLKNFISKNYPKAPKEFHELEVNFEFMEKSHLGDNIDIKFDEKMSAVFINIDLHDRVYFNGFSNMFSTEKINTDETSLTLNKELDINRLIRLKNELYKDKANCSNNGNYYNDELSLKYKALANEFTENEYPDLNNLLVNFNCHERHIANVIKQVEKYILIIVRNKDSKIHRPKPFLQDYDAIITSSSFRRLQDKTQVYPLEEYDFVRTRLTHTNEVASIAEQITDSFIKSIFSHTQEKDAKRREKGFSNTEKEKLNLLSRCISLIHDIGNPPFGHFGEEVIRDYFRNKLCSDWSINGFEISTLLNEQMKNDFIYFDGNAQGLRVISKLQKKDSRKLSISLSIIAGMIKYPYNSLKCYQKSKMGYFYSENDVIMKLSSENHFIESYKNPLSLILEAADDITNLVSDFEDAIKKGIITESIFEKYYQTSKKNNNIKKFFEDYKGYKQKLSNNPNSFSYAVSKLMQDLKKILIKEASEQLLNLYRQYKNFQMIRVYCPSSDYEYHSDLLSMSKYSELIKFIKNEFFSKCVYVERDILKSEIEGYKIITTLLDYFIPAVVHCHTNELNHDLYATKKKYYQKIYELISSDYKENFIMDIKGKNDSEKAYYILRLAVDYISGMTDTYAKNLYRELEGIK